jgi:hypothetical protein
VRKALSTLPWVEQGTMVADTKKQEVRFAVKDKKDFNLDELKQAIEEKTPFKLGKVLKGPEEG